MMRISPTRAGAITRGSARLLAVLAVLALVTSCAGTPPARVAYNSIDGAVTAVQTAIKAADASGKITPENRPQVKAAYEKFQKAALLATDLAQNVTNKEAVTKIISDAANDVIGLIKTLGVQ